MRKTFFRQSVCIVVFVCEKMWAAEPESVQHTRDISSPKSVVETRNPPECVWANWYQLDREREFTAKSCGLATGTMPHCSLGCMCITVLRIKARKHTYSYLFYIQSSASCNFILLRLVNTLLNCLWQCRCCFFRVVAANDMDIRAKNRVWSMCRLLDTTLLLIPTLHVLVKMM